MVDQMTILKGYDRSTILYLNGALSPTLYREISGFGRLTVVLDNFTLYQTIPTRGLAPLFLPALHLRYPVKINGMFIQNDIQAPGHSFNTLFPDNAPVCDLFKDTPETTRLITGDMVGRMGLN